MPKVNRELIRGWLDEHNWTVRRLARECSIVGADDFPEATMRNVVNGIDPMRPGRIKVICRVTAKYGDGIPYEQLVMESGCATEYGVHHLSVSMTRATHAALDIVAETERVSVAEALRRLVGYGALVYRTVRVDRDELLVRRGGLVNRIVLTDVDPAADADDQVPSWFSR
ncbi:hypothetical protein [Actinophytocola sediminis]